MGTRASDGTSLQALIKMAVPLLREAERQCPRTGPGAKPVIPDWLIGALIMVAVLKRKKSKSAQYRFLSAKPHRELLAQAAGCRLFPSRSGFFRRYRRAHQLFRVAVYLQGRLAIAEGVTDASEVAVDKSLIAARGPAWHIRDRQRGKVPAGVDRDSTWGYSEHDGWVHGYSYEVVVSATPGTTVFPLLASVDTASRSETRSFVEKTACLPSTTLFVSADSGYDANALGEQIEHHADGRRTGRRFLCPENPRNNRRPKRRPCKADAARARSRELRRRRKKFLLSRAGQRIYSRRKKTVEPFNQWFKSLFELDDRVWHRKLDNNQTQILAAVFAYQLLLRHNFRCGRKNGQIQRIIDVL
jgi:hypothetical protein